MGASYKATQVSVLPLSVCFLNSIPSHCFSCLQNLCVSTLESSLLSLLSLSTAGPTHTTPEVAAPVKHKEGAGPPLSTVTRCSSVTQPKGQSLFSLLSNEGSLQTPCTSDMPSPQKAWVNTKSSSQGQFPAEWNTDIYPLEMSLKIAPREVKITGESISELLSRESPATQVEMCSTHHWVF